MNLKKDSIVREYCKSREPALKDKIVVTYTPLVQYIARKLSFDRGDLEDVAQIGVIGLLKALERFDPKKEVDFSTFATPNVIGEIRHYFRDKRNIVKIPRKLQELYSKVKNYIKVEQVQGRSPTILEIANALNVEEDRVIEALEAKHTTSVMSLDTPLSSARSKNSDGAGGATILDNIGVASKEDFELSKFSLRDAIKQLDEREQAIIQLKFYRGLSQSEIADELGLSQMHISRLLQKIIKKIRKIMNK